MYLYTSDGSFLRLELPFDGTSSYTTKTWRLYLPDGTIVQGIGERTTKFTDPNGLSVTISSSYNSTTGVTTWSQTEDQAPSRSVTLTYGSLSNPFADTVTWQGYLQTLTTTVNWGSAVIGSYDYVCQAQGNFCNYSSGSAVVTSIDIPVANSAYPQSYQFEYRDLSHCFDVVNNVNLNYSCFGELGKILLPSANSADRLTVEYKYGLEGQALNPDLLDNPVKQKKITYIEHSSSGDVTRSETTDISVLNNQSTFTNPAGGITHHYFFDKTMLSDPLRGLVYRTDNPDGSRVQRLWWRNRTNVMDSSDPGNPYVRIEVQSLPNSSGVPTTSSAKQFTVDRNGNATKVEEYSWGTVPSASVISALPAGAALVRQTASSYFNSVTDAGDGTTPADEANAYWNPGAAILLHLLKRQAVQNEAATPVDIAVTQIEYDSVTTTGNKTVERRWNSDKDVTSNPLTNSNSAVTLFSYSSSCAGRPDTITDPNGYKTKVTYDGNCFPQSQYNAYTRGEQRQTNFIYDGASGLMTQSKDMDNVVTTIYGYDKLGRRTSIREATDSSTAERDTSIIYDDPRRRVVTRRDKDALADGKLIVIQQFDSRGLNWLSQEIDDGTLPADTDTASGIRVERRAQTTTGFSYELVSNPYKSTSDTSMGWTLTRRDAGGRLNQVTNYAGSSVPGPWASSAAQLGSTSTTYNGGTTTTTDAAGKVSTVQIDALGRITSATAGSMSTTNTYDLLDNLSTVSQGTQQVRTFTYSSLSRLISSTQPENGTTSYSYDNNGNLLTRTDGRGWAQTYVAPTTPASELAYDGLGRPREKKIQIGASAATTQSVTWTWDTVATNGKGRLGSVTYGDTTIAYTAYDAFGRVLNHKQTTAGTDYPFSYTYFRNDEPKTITYPSGRTVTYTLDAAGRPNSASATARSYVNNATYAPHGGLSFLDLSSNILRVTWPSPNARLQTESIKVVKSPNSSPSTVLELGYTYISSTSGVYNNNGNPLTHSINDGASTRSQTYTYDSANRLATANETNGFTQTYNYDSYNNRWLNTTDSMPGGFYTPSSASYYNTANNRAAAAPGQYFSTSFDSAGNMTEQNTSLTGYANTNSWDAAGRKSGSTLTFGGTPYPIVWSFDGLDQRVKKDHPTLGTTVFVHDAFGNLAAEYSLTAYSDCATCYIFTDTLGSTRLVTDSAGTAINRFDYMPFGEGIWAGQPWSNGRTGSVYGGPSSVKPQFTGSYRDDQVNEWGADYFGARYFNRAYGRFLSPDANLVDQHPADPLSWNLYSYVRNNPLRYVDPTGNEVELLGNEEQRKQELALLRRAVGNDKAASLIGVKGVKSGDSIHYMVTIKGDVGAFMKLSETAHDLANLVQHKETLEFGLTSKDLSSVGGAGTYEKGEAGNQNVRALVNPSQIGIAEARLDPRTIFGAQFWGKGRVNSFTPDVAAWHEFGHAWGFMNGRVGDVTNKESLDWENRMRVKLYGPLGPQNAPRIRHIQSRP